MRFQKKSGRQNTLFLGSKFQVIQGRGLVCFQGEMFYLAGRNAGQAEIDLYSNAFKTADELRISSAERYDKEIEELKSLIKEATHFVTCVKEITELPEYRQAIATKVIIEWLEKSEKIK